ncbi:N-acetyllactosaminide beta-1,3-N-acetylglucosaminyltransferase 3-like [Cyprinodon tularosa]|uniref:N-acetyllactosaminide beta-1,3-N-acetylglucosaminyltransferase 3-like n=1 Tax=Cyprinodon tularosa TaxID=77115 RepID=UPI0018E28D77|nr:N-acetyllactosaminide beta-1,3-N-acetylglucosaminyltransferase 3-like [Cyprinodon tularosa]
MSYIYNLSLCLGVFPSLWKTSCVVQVPKMPHAKETAHFRPVTLASHLMKTMKSLILAHLRISETSRRHFQRVSIITSLMVLTIVLVILSYSSEDVSDSDSTILQVDVRNYQIQLKSLGRTFPHVDRFPKCVINTSAEQVKDFHSFPPISKDILYYHHCRHFPMILDIPNKCGGAYGSSDIFLLLVIKSPAVNYDRREVLRKTWAEERLSNGVWIRRIFISGTMGTGYEKERLNKLLQLEQRKYNDILQWDFKDTFSNLTLKQILFLEWFEKNCPNTQFLFNGDDDVFANTDNMVVYLQHFKRNGGRRHLFAGNVMPYMDPIRHPQSRYFVPEELYRPNIYPDYCSGGGYLLSGYTALIIYNMSHSIPLIPIDDAYMGMCLAEAGLRPEHHIGVRPFGLNVKGKNVDELNPCFYKEMLVVHSMLSGNMYTMWHRIQDPDLKCAPSNPKM